MAKSELLLQHPYASGGAQTPFGPVCWATACHGYEEGMPLNGKAREVLEQWGVEANQDALCWRVYPWGVFAGIADGAGSYTNSGLAALWLMHQALSSDPSSYDLATILSMASENTWKSLLSRGRQYSQGATTGLLTEVIIGEDGRGQAHCVWVGDSRLYVLREGELYPISRDDCWLLEQVEQGRLSSEAARRIDQAEFKSDLTYREYQRFERRNGTRLLFAGSQSEIHYESVDLALGDLLVLMTDGVSDNFPEALIKATLNNSLVAGLNPAFELVLAAQGYASEHLEDARYVRERLRVGNYDNIRGGRFIRAKPDDMSAITVLMRQPAAIEAPSRRGVSRSGRGRSQTEREGRRSIGDFLSRSLQRSQRVSDEDNDGSEVVTGLGLAALLDSGEVRSGDFARLSLRSGGTRLVEVMGLTDGGRVAVIEFMPDEKPTSCRVNTVPPLVPTYLAEKSDVRTANKVLWKCRDQEVIAARRNFGLR